jgi:alpha-tubulin suppressor-like RCC1 family protein
MAMASGACVSDSNVGTDAGDSSTADSTKPDTGADTSPPNDASNDVSTDGGDAASAPTITEIASGQLHACALFSDGHIDCWGDNSVAQLGVSTAGNATCVGGTSTTYGCRTQPVKVQGITNAKHIAAGTSFTCAIDASGAVLCWGLNHLGQLGHPTGNGDVQCTSGGQTYACNPTPTVVNNATNAVEISLGAFHACYRSSSNSVGCWGDNSQGELGNTSAGAATSTVTTPTGLPGPIAQIRAGFDYDTCAVTVSGGQVWCWGFDDWAQLDALNYASFTGCISICIKTPQPALATGYADGGTLANIESISLGHAYSCAQQTGDGPISCWGIPHDYDIITSTAPSGSAVVPTAIPTAAGTSGFLTRWESACTVADGGRMCWGSNNVYQLGDGTTTSTTTPKSIAQPADIVQMVTGTDSYFALDKNGKVFAWGGNEAGQLGHAQSLDVACGSGNATFCNGTPLEVKPFP